MSTSRIYWSRSRPINQAPGDVLIAVSARGTGAVLITKNEKDFELIRDVYDFKYLVV